MRTVVPPKKEQLYQITCSNEECEAIIEVAKKELRIKDDRAETFYVLVCPHCKKETWINCYKLKNLLSIGK